jgi:antitoxin component YwqK of YwqJK toxin-antitoxin module
MTEEINQRDTQGRRQGVWEEYYENGSLWWRVHYHHGELQGLWESYLSDGTPLDKTYYLRIK